MLIHAAPQGTPEWHRARAGCITASMFRVARERLKTGPNKGDFSAAAKDYAFRLAIERISGEPLDEGFETWAMKRGHELEPDARMEHELQIGVIVQPAGFVTTDDGLFGASADGLIGDDGGSEYKCLVSATELRAVLTEDEWSKYRDQVQGCMWITGRAWWEFCMYCPALRSIGRQLYRQRVERDDDYIADLEFDLGEFARLVSRFEAALRAPVREPEEVAA